MESAEEADKSHAKLHNTGDSVKILIGIFKKYN